MRKVTLSIAAATLATAGVAIADPQMGGRAPQGDVTRAQAEATAAARFATMDVNSDGKLDAADRTARQARAFDRIDADNNGAISRDEFTARRGPQRDGADATAGTRKGGKRGGMRGGRMGMAQAADTNNDGAITQAEFTAGALTMFTAADADRNGTVTQAERKAARDAMRAQWQQRRAARTQAN